MADQVQRSRTSRLRRTKGALCRRRTVRKTMGEYKRRRLRSSSGQKVLSRQQAIAIALSQADRHCTGRPVKRRTRESKRRARNSMRVAK